MTNEHRPLMRSPPAVRLNGGFVAVAVVAVFAHAGLALWRTKHSFGQLARDRQQASADVIASTLGLSYEQSGGWEEVDPHSAMMVAVQAGASPVVLDTTGNEIQLRDSMGNMQNLITGAHGPTRASPVIVAAAFAAPSIAIERCDLAEIAAGPADALHPLAEANGLHVNLDLQPTYIDGGTVELIDAEVGTTIVATFPAA
jgi:hypothetical protein